MAKIFNISPRFDFLEVLADYIIQTAKENNINIADDIIFLPTRRACRSLKEIFLKLFGDAALLPSILPLGDVDENGLAFIDYDNDILGGDILPSISHIERNLILAKFIKAKTPNLSDEQSLSLSSELSHLIDTVEMEELSFNDLEKIVPEEFSIHFQETLEFLKIVSIEYPKFLKELNLQNPVQRKIDLIKKQIEFWKLYPPKSRIFAAGSTGSLVPISRLLRFISKMENGFLILPGLDKTITDNDFNYLTSTYPKTNQNHTQYGLLNLIKSLGKKPNDIEDIPLFKNYETESVDKEIFANNIMLSAFQSSNWSDMPDVKKDILQNISQITFEDMSKEVLGISLLLREAVEKKTKTILITPDRKIAKSVINELKRWDINVDDSAGYKASDMPTGNYLILILKMIMNDFSPYSLLSVLKHGYTNLDIKKEELENIVAIFENETLRGKIGVDNLDLIIAKTKNNMVENLLNKILFLTKDFKCMMESSKTYPISELLEKHLGLVDEFVKSEYVDEKEILWGGDLSSSLSLEISNLLKNLKDIRDKNYDIDMITAKSYFTFISQYLFSLNIRPTGNTNPYIAIMNSIEARLIPADLYIMSGLNEGTFPALSSDDPWMNRPMKAKFNLPLPERKIGLSSHDFVEFFCKKNVVMTNSSKVDGVNTITSRWITKFNALRELKSIPFENSKSKEILNWISLLEGSQTGKRIQRPAPTPPISARPKELSATWIEKWYRDPYIVYAGKILKLNKLEDINPIVGAREFGNLIHDSFEEFKNKNLKTYDELINIMKEKLVPYNDIAVIDFWMSKIKDIARAFVAYEESVKNDVVKSYLEIKGELKITDNFKITAKADRIDILKDNTAHIYDYKTGSPPSLNSVRYGYSPQLLIEGIILENNGFKDIDTKKKVSKVSYMKLGGSKNGEITSVDEDVDEVLENTEKNLKTTLHYFSNEDTPYLSRPNPNKVGDTIEKYSEYTHLARIKEWGEN